MTLIPEPIPVSEDDALAQAYLDDYLRMVFFAAQNLSLTSRDGAIQHNDKAGNLDAKWVVFTSNGTANTEDTVAHDLGRVPVGIEPNIPDKAAALYDGGTAHTSTNLYLKSSAATVAWEVLVF